MKKIKQKRYSDSKDHMLDMQCMDAIREIIGLESIYWTKEKTKERFLMEEVDNV